MTLLLALLIGAGGALLLPRLMHRDPGTVGQGEVHLDTPGAAGFLLAGSFRLQAMWPDRRPLDLTLAVEPPMRPDAIRRAFLDLAHAAGATEVAEAGALLTFPGVSALGGDPGLTGAPLSLGLAGAVDGITLEVREGPTGLAPKGPQVRVGLTATGEAAGAVGEPPTASLSRTMDWLPAHPLLEGLAGLLREAGWDLDETEVGRGRLRLLRLPGGSPVRTLRLLIRYHPGDEAPAGGTWLWRLSL